MYIYKYVHTWRAARNVKRPPANNYDLYYANNTRLTGAKYPKTFESVLKAKLMKHTLLTRGAGGGECR